MKIKITQLLFLMLAQSYSLVSQTTSPEPPLVFPQEFVHPGLLQRKADLEYMKAKIKSGDPIWVAAHKKLQEETSTDSETLAFTFQLAPGDADLNPSILTAETNFEEGYNLAIQTLPLENISMVEAEGPVSFVYTQKEPRPAFSYRMDKEKNSKGKRYITTLIPYENVAPEIKVDLMGKTKPGAQKMSIKEQYDGKSDIINYQF